MSEMLLEYVYSKSGLSYISDLRLSYNITKLMPMIEQIDEAIFGVVEWNQFVSYVFGKQIDVNSKDEAIQLLKQFSEK